MLSLVGWLHTKISKRLQNYYSFSYIKLSKHLFIRSANKSIVVSGNYLAYGSGRIVFLTADGCIQHVLPPVKCDTVCRCQQMVLCFFIQLNEYANFGP